MRRTTIFSVLLLAATTMSAHAATIIVTNTNDSGPGSLRQALANANNGNRYFAVTDTIALTSGELVVARKCHDFRPCDAMTAPNSSVFDDPTFSGLLLMKRSDETEKFVLKRFHPFE
jgi:hypothetical protein